MRAKRTDIIAARRYTRLFRIIPRSRNHQIDTPALGDRGFSHLEKAVFAQSAPHVLAVCHGLQYKLNPLLAQPECVIQHFGDLLAAHACNNDRLRFTRTYVLKSIGKTQFHTIFQTIVFNRTTRVFQRLFMNIRSNRTGYLAFLQKTDGYICVVRSDICNTAARLNRIGDCRESRC